MSLGSNKTPSGVGAILAAFSIKNDLTISIAADINQILGKEGYE